MDNAHRTDVAVARGTLRSVGSISLCAMDLPSIGGTVSV
eukprot:SAG25_NODE_9237_length_381_cov_1.102837_2_plen_38_part_01